MNSGRNVIARRSCAAAVVILLAACFAAGTRASQAPSAQQLYESARAADRDARVALAQPPDKAEASLVVVREAVRKYRAVVLRHPVSGYCDDALWYGALLSAEAFGRFGQDRDRQTAVQLLKMLRSEYPASAFVQKIKARLDRLEPATASVDALPPAVNPAPAAPRSVDSNAPPAPAKVVAPAPAAPSPAAPAAPSTNSRGGFSISRQLGLRVGKVVIDPGHGGTDPGALGNDISEAAITLDIALKLETLLTQTMPLEVVLTRRSDAFVGLQERTAIANRENADLFVSIHVNANSDRTIRGIETFLLDFASTPAAAAVAARENASSTMTMSHLNDVVRQIALSNKLTESRDLAAQLQSTMVRRLRGFDKGMKDLGVKQAPFVVLLGASMPSVLVEVAFLTNKVEAQLLSTAAHRQRIAESLSDGIGRYLQSLKKGQGVAGPPAEKLEARLP